MDSALYARLIDRLDKDASMAEHAELVLAAYEGPDVLEEFLGTGPRRRSRRGTPRAEPAEPAGAYLRNIRVEGFRGVGAKATVEVSPGPGLTLVVGRNGSGKSSLAEGLEVLLTGDSYRWKDRVKVWRDGWRNLHHPSPASVGADVLIEDDRGLTSIVRTWPESAEDVSSSDVIVQPRGKPQTDLASLGWEGPLEAFRPFLTYSELGSMLEEGPSRLYDTLSSILGLGDLVAAERVLRDGRLARTRTHDEALGKLQELLRNLEELDDERARRCLEALAGRTWDLEAAAREVAGLGGADEASEWQGLRQMAFLELPSQDDVDRRVQNLESAAEGLAALVGTDADRAQQTADLLKDALRYHEGHGDGDCPVCGREGALDAGWRERSLIEIERLEGLAREVREARRRATDRMSDARALLGLFPNVLLESETVGINSRDLREAWGEWHDGVNLEEPGDLAKHLSERHGPLAELVDEVRIQASALMKEREDRWRPVAQQLAGWLSEARPAAEGLVRVKALKEAEDWVKRAQSEIRDERFQPIAEQALRIWELLRAGSHVELAKPALEGAGTRRRVRLEVTVDGFDGAALGVMSQGELHSLALSLFLPRVTMPESPFRFIVIDDPVQSMDPIRVDGLARVLEETARDRQVVVFTHDDRLPESMRRLGVDARVIEVTRRTDSVVELRPALDPVTRYFADAHAIVKTVELPATAARRVIPGLCRLGVEAASLEASRRRRLTRGEPHTEVEDLLSHATTTTMKAALALFDDVDRGGDVLPEINRRFGRREADAFRAIKGGTHYGYGGDLADMVRYSAELARGIQGLS